MNVSTSSAEYTAAIPVKAGANIEPAGIFSVDATGHAINPTTVAGSTAMGRAENEADNTNGGDGDLTVLGRRGACHMDNSGVTPLTSADIGQDVYLEDAQTVCKTQVDAEAVAGKFLGFDAVGQCKVVIG